MLVSSPHPSADPIPQPVYRPPDHLRAQTVGRLGRWSDPRPLSAPVALLFCRETQALVARVYAVPASALRHPTRGRVRIALARQVAMYLAHVVGGVTLTAVGRAFGRDRTTVAHACARVEDLRDDPAIDRPLTILEQSLRASFRLDRRGRGDGAIRSTKSHAPRRGRTQ